MYGSLTAQRAQEIRALSNAVSVDSKLRKIYSVLHQVGFDQVDCLDAQDKATLTLVEKYVKFKQGEVWMSIASHFHTTGFRPTAADRARLKSGIDFSEHLSTIVMKDQANLFREEQEGLSLVETKQYRDKLNQAQLDYDNQFYKKDKSKVSANEKSQARKRRDDMIEASRAATSKELADRWTDAGEATGGGIAAIAGTED